MVSTYGKNSPNLGSLLITESGQEVLIVNDGKKNLNIFKNENRCKIIYWFLNRFIFLFTGWDECNPECCLHALYTIKEATLKRLLLDWCMVAYTSIYAQIVQEGFSDTAVYTCRTQELVPVLLTIRIKNYNVALKVIILKKII